VIPLGLQAESLPAYKQLMQCAKQTKTILNFYHLTWNFSMHLMLPRTPSNFIQTAEAIEYQSCLEA